MTISFVNTGAYNSGSTNSLTVAYPTSVDTGNMLLAFLSNKPFDSPVSAGTAGWSEQAAGTSGSVGSGNGTGSVRGTVFQKDAESSDSNTNSSWSWTSPNATVTQGRIIQFARSVGNSWSTASTILTDTTETLTTVSATGTQIAISTGDMLVMSVHIKDDAPNHTLQTLMVPGCTLGTITWLAKNSTTSGADGAMYVGYVDVTAGSSSGAPTYTATSSVSGASATVVTVTRLREVNSVAESQTDSADPTDTASPVLDYVRSQSDNEPLVDTFQEVVDRDRSQSDPVDTTDTFIADLSNLQSQTDLESVTDTFTSNVVFDRAQEESALDGETISLALELSFSDTDDLSDTSSNEYGPQQTDATGATDTFFTEFTNGVTQLDSVELLDDTTAVFLDLIFTDGLPTTDDISRGYGALLESSAGVLDTASHPLSAASELKIFLSDLTLNKVDVNLSPRWIFTIVETNGN